MPQQQAASLETAVEFLDIEKGPGFHRAVNDADYTAEVFRHMDLQKAKRLFTVDYYQNPKSRDEEIHLHLRQVLQIHFQGVSESQ